jgi:hypothetical protein
LKNIGLTLVDLHRDFPLQWFRLNGVKPNPHAPTRKNTDTEITKMDLRFDFGSGRCLKSSLDGRKNSTK